MDTLEFLKGLQSSLNKWRTYALDQGFDEKTQLGKSLLAVEIAIEHAKSGETIGTQ